MKSKLLVLCLLYVILVCFFIAPKILASEKKYVIDVEPTILSGSEIKLDITTNIPGTIEVMAAIELSGQKGDDTWIGKDARVKLTNGKGSVVLPTSGLPKGKYEANVSFYPKWGLQDSLAKATGITKNLEASKIVKLTGTGEPASNIQFIKNSQKWIMENINMGDPWNPEMWINKFGKFEELELGRGNPDILKVFYFPKIDMTVIVNVLKKNISVWRLGKENS